MTKFRQMNLAGNDQGRWDEFTSDEFARRHGSAVYNWENLVNRADVTVEIHRNGDWRPASIRKLLSWEEPARLEIKRLEQERGQLLAKPGMRLSGAQGRLQGARGQLKIAASAVKVAEAELKKMEDTMQTAQRAAGKVEDRIRAAEGVMASRHKVEDARVAVVVA